jgi:membrane protein DedA with SNARE-associated domain
LTDLEEDMLVAIEQALVTFLQNLLNTIGWPGVFIAMVIESACIPLPSEVTMPLAGWMLVQAKALSWLWLVWAGLVGAVGNVVGSWIAYWVGQKGGRPVLEKYGRYVLISRHDLDRADAWFAKYGEFAIFFSRLLPVVRTFISFPAGVARMDLKRFSILSLLGSFPWSIALAWAGYVAGEHWEQIRDAMRPFDIPIIAVFLLLCALYVYRKLKSAKADAAAQSADSSTKS